MKLSIESRWVDALRQPTIKQTNGVLHHLVRTVGESTDINGDTVTKITESHSYCCLGVLADKVMDKKFTARGSVSTAFDNKAQPFNASLRTVDADESGVLREETLASIEMNAETQAIFTSMNDTLGLTFGQIADVIGAINQVDTALWSARQTIVDREATIKRLVGENAALKSEQAKAAL